MTFEANIKLRHTDPEVLAADIAALTKLLEKRNNERRDATPNAGDALRAAENLLGNRDR